VITGRYQLTLAFHRWSLM